MNERPLGELLVQHRVITPQELEQALHAQAKTQGTPLGQVLCNLGLVGQALLAELLDSLGKRLRLGEILVRRGVLTPERLIEALRDSKKSGRSLGLTLLTHRMISEEDLVQALAVQHDLPVVSLAKWEIPRELARVLNASYALRHGLIPISAEGKVLTVATAFPSQRHHLHDIESCTGMKVNLVIARESEILQAQRVLYATACQPAPSERDVSGFELSEDAASPQGKSKYVNEAVSPDADMLVRKIIALAIRDRASDIHFEATEDGMLVRYRIDGMLQPCQLGNDAAAVRSHARQIVSKIKVLCDMDIAERRRPQDSSFKMIVKKENRTRTVDFRVSTVPSHFGESLVIRVLDKRGGMMTLDSLDFSPEYVAELRQALERRTGIFLVTGPTGSGKSSTLYAILGHIGTPDTKTLTVEDPVEYSMAGITQTEVNEAIGNTFAKLLRTFLRQDPDNIMVGEIRDLETATIAIRAAMTGHTVLSTLHTNDATGAVTRLIDLGVEPNLLSTTLRGVLAQRLVRRVCGQCSSDYLPPAALRREFGLDGTMAAKFRRGHGCSHCNFTGYSGRLPIVEFWLPTREELLLINQRPDNSTLRRAVFAFGKRLTLAEDGLRRACRGETTLEEIIRIVPFEQIEACRANLDPTGKARPAKGSAPSECTDLCLVAGAGAG